MTDGGLFHCQLCSAEGPFFRLYVGLETSSCILFVHPVWARTVTSCHLSFRAGLISTDCVWYDVCHLFFVMGSVGRLSEVEIGGLAAPPLAF